ncbi:UV DNA damage repair endonuclease UvsE [Alteribacter natronophilus]|uniref:UV DNA damage repair endonuclease UvsE n=1 Tax=Alteribacter natronophilus TaxID=2583810 RepID=UPI00110E3494|nr:UV DNA damage repair endonuclease UvsE [Alteribacter natronophilus]TMW72130.1 UV DNA damage repair endonuclease UvsE [Alteribacter natronophilus]
MNIRFGFVSHALSIWNASPAHTVTWARAKELSKDARTEKLHEVTAKNIAHTKRAIHYCIAHEINLFRLSSSMVPLATHPDAAWDFVTPFRREWEELGELIRSAGIRTSFHPNQFTLFTSPKDDVTERSIEDIRYHDKMAQAMDLPACRFVLHVGGAYGDKQSALKRFSENIRKLPDGLRDRLMIENDDKSYHGDDVLTLCRSEKLPFIFDYHHHVVYSGESSVANLLPGLFDTWNETGLPPKVHLSSPKDGRRSRAHADGLDLEFVRPFLETMREFGRDFDVMIEAKQKDKALLSFLEHLEKVRGVNRIAGATVSYKP